MRGIFRSQSERIVFNCDDDIRIGYSGLARDEAQENVVFVRMSSKTDGDNPEMDEIDRKVENFKKKKKVREIDFCSVFEKEWNWENVSLLVQEVNNRFRLEENSSQGEGNIPREGGIVKWVTEQVYSIQKHYAVTSRFNK